MVQRLSYSRVRRRHSEVFEVMVLEIKDIEKPAMDYARRLGYVQRKFVSPGRRGAGDQILKHMNCRAFFMELKTDEGSVSTRQRKEALAWEKVGVPTYFVFSFKAACKLLHLGQIGQLPKPGEYR